MLVVPFLCGEHDHPPVHEFLVSNGRELLFNVGPSGDGEQIVLNILLGARLVVDDVDGVLPRGLVGMVSKALLESISAVTWRTGTHSSRLPR